MAPPRGVPGVAAPGRSLLPAASARRIEGVYVTLTRPVYREYGAVRSRGDETKIGRWNSFVLLRREDQDPKSILISDQVRGSANHPAAGTIALDGGD
jgi:hypothetical protein